MNTDQIKPTRVLLFELVNLKGETFLETDVAKIELWPDYIRWTVRYTSKRPIKDEDPEEIWRYTQN